MGRALRLRRLGLSGPAALLQARRGQRKPVRRLSRRRRAAAGQREPLPPPAQHGVYPRRPGAEPALPQRLQRRQPARRRLLPDHHPQRRARQHRPHLPEGGARRAAAGGEAERAGAPADLRRQRRHRRGLQPERRRRGRRAGHAGSDRQRRGGRLAEAADAVGHRPARTPAAAGYRGAGGSAGRQELPRSPAYVDQRQHPRADQPVRRRSRPAGAGPRRAVAGVPQRRAQLQRAGRRRLQRQPGRRPAGRADPPPMSG
ncbi:Uncharacterised protein [Serratia ficaria]|nr:Uncharacterised protein [Serratia ficaria]